MRLKKIRLAGFKSFVDPTNIPFPGDMTAIVGPNGCGKSNVIDAVRWVLGESSAKNLRGDAMTDVIFNGSTSRKALGQCSVELVFDNSSGRIQGEFAAFNEISVKRVVTKEAVSSYYLNTAKCRRRDVTDLFLGTGLGPRSYAIIEQGMIAKLIESKPQELRIFIEEAAGISKYKERRRETQNRISHTKENLDRLEDVRSELGTQIAKLGRQAAAATKYKELKQNERQLKAELATIKWLDQNEIVSSIDAEINEKNTVLEDLVSGLQGDESGLQSLKNKQSMLKQQHQDAQQQLFKVGTDITKLEQSQLYAKKRASQIQSEIEQIKQSEHTLVRDLNAVSNEAASAKEKLLEAQPEKEIAEAQLAEVESKKLDVDEQLHKILKDNKRLDDEYYLKKQALQQKHGQIQQTVAMQQRNAERIGVLQQESAELKDTSYAKKLQSAEQDLTEIKTVLSEYASEKEALSQLLNQASDVTNQRQKAVDSVSRQVVNIQAKLDAQQSLQNDSDEEINLNESFDELTTQTAWQYFDVEAGFEAAVDAVLQHSLQQSNTALIVDGKLNESISDILQAENLPSLLFSDDFTREKKAGSLAEKINNTAVPAYFNHFIVVESTLDALQKCASLSSNMGVVTVSGRLFFRDRIVSITQSDSKLVRAALIEDIREALDKTENELRLANKAFENAQEKEKGLQETLSKLEARISKQQEQKTEQQILTQNLAFQLSQMDDRLKKLQAEIASITESSEQEDMSLELLNEEVEILSVELSDTEDKRNDFNQRSESLQAQQQNMQIQFNQAQQLLHTHALTLQQLQNSLQILQEQGNNKQTLLDENREKLALLNEEAEELLLPENEQEEKLQALLAKQELLRNNIGEQQLSIDKVDQEITELEKGQQGLQARMDSIKSEIESLRIRSESASVRSQSYLEQLAETGLQIKDVLAKFEQEASDNEPGKMAEQELSAQIWQENLEKVSAAISRLGAVNLAAVAEFEEQSTRKKHLDAQNEDLSKALDTLEEAMRKIDKETRTRFKTTYDKVNADLKSLFPKVFGGGSAYLELTGDDLLETGVTIMARPPGKKNSTIQLLSGGEKALTALSLVFAIFRLNPAPFCLLDEVDAPLDDANVGRFCRLVSEMSETVQFIYISHNKVAMEMATHLTGVTMAEPGVSRMVAVDMEQALAIAE
ncbi:chromosome segregation protein SMC [Glaciecola petra]|uniref:Chromosome partition protein Smc n=1 Tax=Glaciecola petra TaxID=3075602 RepID=A0ABU2ZPE7_9ALTE|nr:chromosome segregation protein SMC [Aestuariibacter sp. P117]MDT0594494.1 chromosome segregation protein SMC [Aestuariibacter sp. P117]